MHPLAALAGQMIGGIVAMFFFSMLLDWAVVRRIADDRVKGALGSVLAAYLIGSLIYAFNDPWVGGAAFIIYLPGAIIAGIVRGMLAHRKQQREAEDQWG